MIEIKAVIMSGGKGTRLRPLTCDIPKPMVPIINKPVMEYAIELLKEYNIKDIAVTMAYLPSVITGYFGDGSDWGVNLHYFTEEVPLGTGGSVKNAQEFLDETFIVISGDAMTDINLTEALKYHKEKGSKATLVLKKESIPLEYGVIITDDDGKIVRFLEKPNWGEVFSDTINTGIYILEPEVLKYYNKGDNFDFSKDLFPKLLHDKIPMYGYITDDYWCDIGDLDSYKTTQFDILEGKTKFKIDCKQVEPGIWIDEGTKLGDDIKIKSPVYIGSNCLINNKVNIKPYSVVGRNCVIDEETSIKRSILWENSRIGKNCQLRGSVICSGVSIKNRVSLFENSVIGVGSLLSSGVTIKPDIKIWPHKKIEEGMVVNQNLVWGTKASKSLFGYRDISGDINVEITPEFASRLGSTFASLTKGDDSFVISSDDSSAACIIKNSLISGILSTGARVIDISGSSIPMSRFAVRHYKTNGGIHVRINCKEANKVHIELIDENGANISRNIERKIENIFVREDFERCNADLIKEIIKVDNFSSFYIQNRALLLDNLSEIKMKNPRLIVSSKSKNIINLTKTFLNYIGCQVNIDYSINDYENLNQYISHVSKQVLNKSADMGIIISENGENIVLIDEKGKIISKEKYTAMISLIILETASVKKLVVPYNSPNIIEKLADRYKVKVVRTKSNLSDMINEMLNMEKNDDASLLQYNLNFDALLSIGKIIDFLTHKQINLSQLAREIPNFHFIKEEIACDWKEKGRVIREMIEDNKDKDIELFEGVKINEDRGWTLILPDIEKPIFNVYTEGVSEEYAKELSIFFSKKVKSILKNQSQDSNEN